MVNIQKIYKMRAELYDLIIKYLLKNNIKFNSCDNMHQSKIIFYSYKAAKKVLQHLFKTQRKYYYFVNSYYKRFTNKKERCYKSKIMKNYDPITDKIISYYIYF